MNTIKTTRARSLRRSETDAERTLRRRLRDRRLAGQKVVRQDPIGPFFAGFACREAGLVVELDGSQHADALRDVARDAFLVAEGFAVLRFWNNEVFAGTASVRETILAAAEGRLEPYDRHRVPSSRASRHLLPGGEKGRGIERTATGPSPRVDAGFKRADERTSFAANPFHRNLA